MSISKIKIAYAYEGLIYLPLFLAKELNYLPINVELVYAGGDKEAIQRVIKSENIIDDLHCDFAICDPFIESDLDEANKKAHTIDKSKPILVIGCLIDNPPFWLYTEDTSISKISGLKELFTNKKIKTVHGYAHPNTGYLYSKDLIHHFEKIGKRKDVNYQMIDFTPKKEIKTNTGEILVTANVVKAAKDEAKIIYTYATGEDDNDDFSYLRNLLFTGIITRKEILTNGLGLTVEILNGLKRAIKLIVDDDPLLKSDAMFDFFKNQLKEYDHLKSYSDDQLKGVRDSILKLLKKSDLYSEDLSFNKEQWKRMDTLRINNDEHKKLNYFVYSNSSISNIVSDTWNVKIKKPDGYFWFRVFNNSVLNFSRKLFYSNISVGLLTIFYAVLNIKIELANKFSDWSYSSWTFISILLIVILNIYTYRAYIFKKKYNKTLDVPEVLFILVKIYVFYILMKNAGLLPHS